MKYIVYIFEAMFAVLFAFYITSEFQFSKIRNKYKVHGEFANIDGSRLHYVDVKSTSASSTPVLFIHGASSNLNDHFNLFTINYTGPSFRNKARLIFVDRPGHGYSDIVEEETPDLQAKRYVDLLDALGVEQVVLVSHSMGSVSALAMALHYPSRVKGVLLIAPVGYPDSAHVQWYHRLAATPVIGSIFTNTLVAPFRRTFLKDGMVKIFHPQIISYKFPTFSGMDLELQPKLFRHNAREVAALSEQTKNLSRRYKEIRQKVVIVAGDRDAIVEYSKHAVKMKNDIPGAEMTILPQIGHKPEYQVKRYIMKAILELAR